MYKGKNLKERKMNRLTKMCIMKKNREAKKKDFDFQN